MKADRKAHRARFNRWCKLGGQPLVHFSRLVQEQLLPKLAGIGFVEAEDWPEPSCDPVGGGELLVQRDQDNAVDLICFNFDKYHRPRVQVSIYRRALTPPYALVRSANLVKRSSQYYHWWGQPWWLPTRFWAKGQSNKAIDRLATCLLQSDAFLQRGERGPNMSRYWRGHSSIKVLQPPHL